MKPLEIEGVSRETLEKLWQYHALLLKWQKKINLISPNTVKDAWNRHFLDSVQIAPLLPNEPLNLYDLGCGAGFAGMVLAIVRPDISVTLIESDSKKCAFLQTVSRETGTPVTIKNDRIERAAQSLNPPDFVTARALASLEGLLKYCGPWLEKRPDMRFIFPKGEQFAIEIEQANKDGWAFDCVQTVSVTDPKARVLSLTNVRKSPV